MHVHVTRPAPEGQVGHQCSFAMPQVKAVGAGKLVLDLSCRKRNGKYFVVADRWQRFTDLEVNAETLQQLGQSCAEFLVHGVDVEGKQLGINEELIRLLSAHSPKPVTYAGGVRDLVSAHSGNVSTGLLFTRLIPEYLHCRRTLRR